ncbi:MAG: ATP-binding protein [Elusimicrobia bacterium]|nr:ATP-binding protein [Elusimicrobiota bacterium]
MSSITYKDINLLGINDGIITGLSGEAGLSFELFPQMDLRMCPSAEHPAFVSGFSRLLSCLPPSYGLMFEAEVNRGSNLSMEICGNGIHPILKKIQNEKSERWSRVGRSVRHYAHLWSSGLNPLKLRMLPSLMPSKNKQKSLQQKLEENESSIIELSSTLASSLNSCGVSSRILSSQEILERYWTVLCPTKSIIHDFLNIDPSFSLRSQLACSNSEEKSNYFYMDGMYHTTFSFYTYPDEISLGALDNLIEILPLGTRYLFSVLAPDQEEFIESLKVQRRRTVALLGEAKTKDYESEARENDLDTIITRCRNEGERIYVVWAALILRSPELANLLEWQKQLLFTTREIFSGAQGLVEDCLHRRTFLSSLPFGGHLSPRRNLMLGSTAAALAPISRPWQGTKRASISLVSQSKEPAHIDIFDKDTPRHGIVIGTTGSGKSFLANMLLISLLSDPKIRALVIDIGGSFKRITNVLEGAYFDVKLDEKYAMNPILPRSSMMKSDGTLDPEMLGAQTSLLAKITQCSSGPARLVLEKAIEAAFLSKDEPLLSDILYSLRNNAWQENLKEQAQLIISQLLPYCEGVYSLLLSHPSRIRPFEKQITTFDLAGLKEHRDLQNIVVNVIAFTMSRQLEDKSIKKVVIIDEAWEFFNDPQSADLIARLYRQARKQNASIITLSQSPIEFLNSACASAILSNKHWCLALKMTSGHDMLEKFGFSDQAIQKSKSMQMSPKSFSEVMVKFGENAPRILRVSPISEEYWIATTNAEECTREEKFRKEQNLNQLESILEMAKAEPVVEW